MNERLTEQKSIYLQISEMIETDILRGILLEEEQVPSTNELARLYTINPATAAKGVNLLVDKLAGELEDAMAMCGAHTLADINRSMVRF